MARKATVTAAFAATLALLALPVGAQASDVAGVSGARGLSGSWQATATGGSLQIPFRFELHQSGGELTGWLFNGDTRVVADHASVSGNHIVLRFDQFARKLDLIRHADGSLDGTYEAIAPTAATARAPADPAVPALSAAAGRRSGRGGPVSFQIHAQRRHATSAAAGSYPSIGGVWLIPAQSRKVNEKAWRFIVRQNGADVDAAILRVDGDTGTLSGTWNDGHLLLSNFSGTRAELLEVTPAAQGTLTLTVHDLHRGNTVYTAYTLQQATDRGLPGAANAAHHTDVRDRNEVFRFAGTDLAGHSVSSSDAKFAGKVVLVDVSGSWCPNCHDEAPFLETLYRRFHAQGLEIVALDFEEADQLGDPARLRAFVQAYRLGYTVLLDGTPDQVHDKLPQAVDLDAWPTTFFIGRDGRVKAVHTGFAAPASGQFYTQLTQAYIGEIKELLAARAPVKSAG